MPAVSELSGYWSQTRVMKQYRWPYLLAAGLMALALGSASADDDDHLLARRALEEGRVLPLAEALAAVKAKLPGKVIEVELEVEDGILVYDLKLLTPGGGLKEIEVDAATGKILKIEDDD
jgi:uncharacterized membrane protein YkoI